MPGHNVIHRHFIDIHQSLIHQSDLTLFTPLNKQFDKLRSELANYGYNNDVDHVRSFILNDTRYFQSNEWSTFLNSYLNLLLSNAQSAEDIWKLFTKSYT